MLGRSLVNLPSSSCEWIQLSFAKTSSAWLFERIRLSDPISEMKRELTELPGLVNR